MGWPFLPSRAVLRVSCLWQGQSWYGLLRACLCPSLPTGVGSSSMPLWDFQGSTILTSQYVRLTPDERSKEGSIWNRQVSGSPEAGLSPKEAATPSPAAAPTSVCFEACLSSSAPSSF